MDVLDRSGYGVERRKSAMDANEQVRILLQEWTKEVGKERKERKGKERKEKEGKKERCIWLVGVQECSRQ